MHLGRGGGGGGGEAGQEGAEVAVQGQLKRQTLVLLELFLTVVVDIGTYPYGKSVLNVIPTEEHKLNWENLNKISEFYHQQYPRYYVTL